MIDLGEFKTRSVSGLPDDLVEQFDIVAKRLVGTRSALIKIMMKAVVENARCRWEHEAKTGQFVAHSVNDTFALFGMKVRDERPGDTKA